MSETGSSTPSRSYRDLEVWQRSMALAKDVYQETAAFPEEERMGLTVQMRRTAVSIPSNIAQGQARSAEFQYFVSVAIGSASELETQVMLSSELGYLEDDAKGDLITQLDTIGRMLRGLHKSLSHRRPREGGS